MRHAAIVRAGALGALLVYLPLAGCSDSGTASTAGTGIEADAGGPGVGDAGPEEVEEVQEGTPCTVDADCEDAYPELLECQVSVCSVDTGYCIVDDEPNGTPCVDGYVCTGPDFCVNGGCGGGPLNCDDKDPCTVDSCDGKEGCVNAPASGEACDDDNPCTTDDTCVEGSCEGATAIEGCCIYDAECDDADICTDDTCDDNACVNDFNFAPCQDDNPCTLLDHCDGAGGCEGDPLLCDDGNPCTTDTCNPQTGSCESAPAPDGTACEDGNPCTNPDACEAGMCVGQGSLCQCTADADCVPFEDGNLCNGTLKCLDFLCVVDPITVVACNPTGDTACVKNQCDPATAQCVPTAAPQGTICDDQNPCTDADQCTNGLCIGQAATCDDGNPCTFDACSPTNGCTHVPNSQPCNDGDACTANDQCQGGACVGQPLVCDDFNVCTDDSCDPAQGCLATPNTAACDDGNSCTSGDVCAGGACTSGANTCACVTDADCAPQEDGNLCNGTLACVDNECVVDSDTVVVCNTTGDTACNKTVCLPASGACMAQPSADGTSCDDGTSCTLGDSCQGGVCVGAAADCDDGNLCTNDGCDPDSGCYNNPNQLPCDDGDSCTGNDKCTGGGCSGVAIGCDDGNQCTVDGCDPDSGCVATNAADGTPCSDGNVCTTSDVCISGSCGGTPANCDDGNECTTDTCSNPGGCANAPVANGTPCDDGSECTGGDNCQGGACVGSPPSCDDGDPCSIDTCDPAVGCTYANAPDGTGCTDGDPCTGGDACVAGACVPGSPICGCQSDADCAPEEDGDLCNGTLFCDSDNTCKVDPATVVTCDPPAANSCMEAICQPSTGTCQNIPGPNGVACDDGDGCTTNDQCTDGICTGFGTTCDDGNPCTADSCVGGACQYAPAFDGTPCADDGNPCTLDVCDGGSCGAIGLADGLPCADDGNSCTLDTCQGGACTHDPVGDGLPCADDGNQCTYDQCTGGVCQHISNDPAPVGPNQCFPVAQLDANAGTVTGSWDDCGVADQFDFSCQGGGPNQTCTSTGAIDSWPCADPSFTYDGADTGYEYAYVFVAPITGTCTLIEHEEGIKLVGPGGGGLFGVIDWFILSGDGQCNTNACLEYMWENVEGAPECGGNNKSICSFKSFGVTEGDVFYIVADIFDGVSGNDGYAYNDTWEIEIVCDSGEVLLLDEDFSDALCDGCSTSVNDPGNECQNFDWHHIGGFADITTGYYLGDLNNNTLQGYDCGATSATLEFPAVTLPANATSCTVSFDYYADLDPADDGDCTNDILTVNIDSGPGGPQPIAGDSCAANTSASNPLGSDQEPQSATITYDITSYAGDTVTLSMDWFANDADNVGLGVIIDNVTISCEVP